MSEVVPISEMYIDFGAKSKLELEAAGLQIGDMILPNTQAKKSYNQQKIIGKALDNRVACTIMAQIKIRLKRNMSKSLVWGLFKKRLGHEDRKLPRSK